MTDLLGSSDSSAATPTRPCPVCGADASRSALFLEANIDARRLTELSFASRKTPEFMCHRLVRCLDCDLVYVDAPPSQSALAEAYHAADYDSSREAEDAADTYISVLRPLLARLPRRERALEIGSGTGVFLERLASEGFREVVGVEPSSAAIAAAPPHRRAWIREGIFEEGDFEAGAFDLVCCFMTMEHVRDPGALAGSALRLLRPGGAFVVVAHDYRGLVNRLLGRRSPIIDIQHMQLFSRRSAAHLFERAGFEEVGVASFANRYRLDYWMRLTPLPAPAKAMAQKTLSALGLDAMKLSFNVGNLLARGFRPGGSERAPSPQGSEFGLTAVNGWAQA
jgi:SAM-dependent methyltransferase